MTPIATALASASLLFSAAPAMAQMRAAGGHAPGIHAGGGLAGVHLAGNVGRGGPDQGRPRHFGLRGNGFRDHRHGHVGDGVFPVGWLGPGYGYPWYGPEPEAYDEDGPGASAPVEPAPPPAQLFYRRHNPDACAEWTWSAGQRRFTCTRRAG